MARSPIEARSGSRASDDRAREGEGMAPAGPASYGDALRLTGCAMHRRVMRYRYLAIAVVLLLCGSALWAAVQRAWLPLLAVSLLAPLCGAFFWSDAWLLARWRREILELWARGLDLDAYRKMMMAVPELPPRTLSAMLDTLPALAWLPPATSPHARQAIALMLRCIGAGDVDRAAATAAALTLGLAAPALAADQRYWLAACALGALVLLVPVMRGLALLRSRRWRGQVLLLRRDGLDREGLDPDSFAAVVALSPWSARSTG